MSQIERLDHHPAGDEIIETANEDKYRDGGTEDIEKPPLVHEGVVMRSPFDDMDFFKTFKVFWRAELIAFIAAFSAAADGYQIQMTGSIVANKGFINQFGTAHSKGKLILAAQSLSIWGGVQSLGQGMGMLTTHFVADKYGRKFGFYWLWLVLVGGVLAETLARDWKVWVVAKLLSGYAVGSVQFMTTSYMTEILPMRTRGTLLITYTIWYDIGQVLASTALKVLADKRPLNYLDLIYTEWAVIGIMLVVYLYIPESPWWYANHDQHEKGRAVLQRINGKIQGYDVDYHYGLIKQTVEVEREVALELHGPSKGIWDDIKSFKEVFTGVNGFRTLVAFFPPATQQISGLAVLSNYSSYFAQVAKFADPFVFSLLLALVSIGITVVAFFLTDLIGRRALFLSGVVGTWSCLMIVGGMGLIKNPTLRDNRVTLFFALVWRMVSDLEGTLGRSFAAETGSSRLRVKTAGISSAGGVAVGVLFSTTVPYMLNAEKANWGLKTCFFFAGISLPVCIAAFFIIPDTSKRTPAELDEMFEKKIKPWRFRGYVTEAQLALEAEKERLGNDEQAIQRR
ncbi:hypothetical protein CI109_103897 [Kwoniella shandongensis]|uniref:Uncharacterized protein n=1 Tax=Kwoniella shandongensis TaxID=1734106 RepID=A0A5M6BTG7_9TREE|nr:uncharacterized protein CI109_005649 [Kwoniella shandongensis]KAA5526053.1 hypothetical protein CI109_005649 [Kwoniella shandongensis]